MYRIIDCHADTVTTLMREGGGLLENDRHLSLKKLMGYRSAMAFFAVWLEPLFYREPMKETLRAIDFYYKELEKNKELIGHVNTYSDIIENYKSGKISALLALEGCHGLDGDLSMLSIYHRLGVREMSLTWNFRNDLAWGAADDEGGRGLTALGKKAVWEMNRLGILVDVSHLSDAGFYHVAELAQKPFIASHSNARAVCPDPRNLSDDEIKTLAAAGGVMGINLFPRFLSPGPIADVTDIMRHIDHVIALVGPETLALGSDFDGISETPEDIRDVSCLGLILEAVEKRYGAEAAESISHKNILRVLKEVL